MSAIQDRLRRFSRMILVEIIVLVSWIVIAGVQNAIDNKFDFSDCEPITWHYIKVSWYTAS